MNTYEEDLLAEHVELARDVLKLTEFTSSPEFQELDGFDKMLIGFQLGHMDKYLYILDRRVALL